MATSFLYFSKKCVTVLLVWQSYMAVSGEIILSPKDKEASIGETIESVCATTAGAIEWHHFRAGTDLPEIVYKDGFIYNGYKGRFNIKNCSSDGGECKLIVQNVSLSDAGTYICVENSDESTQKTAELIVYEQYPSTQFCLTRITCSPDCDALELSCNMKYSGNVDASLEWRDSAGVLVPSTTITINDITTFTVQLNKNHSQSPSYTCQVKYPTITLQSRYNWTHKPQDFVASNTEQDEWNEKIVTMIALFVVAIVVLLGIVLGLIIGYSIRRRIRKRKPRRRRSSNSENGSAQSGSTIQHLAEHETPLMNNDPELDSSWTEGEISPRTKANKNKAIHGLSVVDDELFLITREGCIIEVFDLNSSKFKRALSVVGLVNPNDMVSCSKRKRLYICDWKRSAEDKEIVCVDKQGWVETRWISEDEKGRLSITRESHVIVAESWYNTIKEYSPNGQLIRKFQTGKDKSHLWHAIKLLDGNFVASFGDSQDVFQDVCVLDDQGLAIHSFANTFTSQSMAVPRTLAVDGDGNIYVADLYNGRIIMLTSKLQWKGELDIAKTGERLRGPLRICLHEMNDKRQLLVADNKKENGKWMDGKIQILDIQK